LPEAGSHGSGDRARNPLAPVLLLSITLLVGLAALLIAVLMLVIEPKEVGRYVTPSTQDAESLAYFIAFAILLPLICWLVPRYTDGFGDRDGDALTAIAAGLCFTLGLAVGLVRLSGGLPWGSGLGTATVVFGLWVAFALFLLAAGRRESALRRLGRLGAKKSLAHGMAGLGIALGVLSFVDWGQVDPAVLAVGVVVLVPGLYAFGRVKMPDLPAPWGRALDGLVFVLVVLAVPDMVIFPAGPGVADPNPLITFAIQLHHDLFLGPVNQVLDGKVLLVDTVSQYGIAPIYLISAFFEIAPIGHGTLGFFDGILTALTVGAGYLIMRMAGVRRPIAIPAIAMAVIILAWGVTYPIGGLLQHGAIRFGLPVLLIAVVVAGYRFPRITGPTRWLALFLIGLSSVWALEAFAYTLVTWAGLTAIATVWRDPDDHLRGLLREAALAALAIALVQVAFALITLIVSGELPDWGLYLTYLREFLFGAAGDVTYNYEPWSSGVTVAAFYLASTITVYQLARSRTAFVVANRTAFVALAGALAYGIALYTYFLSRSIDFVLPYMLLPLILVVAIGLGLILSESSPVSRGAAVTALGSAAAVGLIALAGVASAIPGRASDSLLGYVVPGGPSLSAGFHRLWDPPQLAAGAAEGERLLERAMPGEDSSAVIIEPNASVEALARAQRANSLGFTDPEENNRVPGPTRPIIEKAVEDLRPGDLMLVNQDVLDVIGALEEDPALDAESFAAGKNLGRLQGLALRSINEDYRLVPVVRGADGLLVVRLEPRR